jgi:hypothetical protein
MILNIIIIFLFLIIIMNSYKIKYKEKYTNFKNNIQNGGSSDYNYKNQLSIYNNFFSNKVFTEIKNYCTNLNFKNDKRVSSRKTLCLPFNKHKKLYNLIYNNKKFKNIVSKIYDGKYNNYKSKPSFPIEYRIYPKGSSGMGWHIDTSLFKPDCLEVVLTIDNTSDSKFLWREGFSLKSKSIKPESNTLAIVTPSTIFHSVSSVNSGYRTILKFIIELEESNPKSTYYKEIKNCPI